MLREEIRPPESGLLARAPSAGLVLGAISSVQFGAALAVHLFPWVGPVGAVVLRLTASAIALSTVWRPRIRGHTRGDVLLAAAFGAVLAGMNLAIYGAIHRIPLGIAVSLEFAGPLTLAVAGSRRPIDIVWALLAAAGIVALTHAGSGGVDGLGIALALLAGCLWGGYILLSARVGRTFDRGSGLALAACFGTVFALPAGIATAGSHLLEPRALAIGAGVGILSSAIPYSFELEALRRIAAPVFGVLMSLEPGVAALAGFLVLGQYLTARTVVGIAMVVTASIGASRAVRRAPVDG